MEKSVNDSQILPCPFCNSSGLLMEAHTEHGDLFLVVCPKCKRSRPYLHDEGYDMAAFSTKEEAIRVWNIRAKSKSIHTFQEQEALCREGEELGGQARIHRDAFRKMVLGNQMITDVLMKPVMEGKNFRAELYYDAEALSVEFLTFKTTQKPDNQKGESDQTDS